MLKQRKKASVIFISLLSLLASGCSNGFTKTDYHSTENMAKIADSYVEVNAVFHAIDGGYSFTASELDGRETLWSDTVEEGQDVALNISLRLSKGMAKVVHVDSQGTVTTVIECLPETSTDGFVTQTVSQTSGKNRWKIVGYDCEDIDLQILFDT